MSKLHFFSMCLRKIGMVHVGLKAPDDRDHCQNKQVQCSGALLATLFRQLWRNFLLELGTTLYKNMQVKKNIDATMMLCSRSKLTSRLMHHFYTGQWSIHDPNTKNGYLQLKVETNDQSAVSLYLFSLPTPPPPLPALLLVVMI